MTLHLIRFDSVLTGLIWSRFENARQVNTWHFTIHLDAIKPPALFGHPFKCLPQDFLPDFDFLWPNTWCETSEQMTFYNTLRRHQPPCLIWPSFQDFLPDFDFLWPNTWYVTKNVKKGVTLLVWLSLFRLDACFTLYVTSSCPYSQLPLIVVLPLHRICNSERRKFHLS